MYVNPIESPGCNRGPANMLGKVLIFAMVVLIGLTAAAVFGLADVPQDLADARRTDAETGQQQAVWEAENTTLPSRVAAELALYLAELDAQRRRIVADIADYEWGQAEGQRVDAARHDEQLQRERLIGRALIGLGALLGAVVIYLGGFTAHRLIDRRLPAPPRVAIPAAPPEPPARETLERPTPQRPMPQRPMPRRETPLREAPQHPTPAQPAPTREMPHPQRAAPIAAPAPVVLGAEDPTYAAPNGPVSRVNGTGPHAGQPPQGRLKGQPLPAH